MNNILINRNKIKFILICSDDTKTKKAAENKLNKLREIIPSSFGVDKSQIITLISAEGSDYERADSIVSIIERETKTAETIIMFYIGKMVSRPDTRYSSKKTDLFLFTYDTRLEYVLTRGISMDELGQLFNQSPNTLKNIIFILDVWGGDIEKVRGQEDYFHRLINLDYLSDFGYQTGKQTLLASALENPPKVGTSENNLESYAYHFIDALVNILTNGIENGANNMTIGEVFDMVSIELQEKHKFAVYPSNNRLDTIMLSNPHHIKSCDVLISYSQSCNSILQSNPLGNITKLYNELKQKVLPKVECRICMSYELVDPLDEEIKQEIKSLIEGTRLLVIVLSTAYPKSSWCNFVLEEFVKQLKTDKTRPNICKIYVIDERSELFPRDLQDKFLFPRDLQDKFIVYNRTTEPLNPYLIEQLADDLVRKLTTD